jgi:hypothetical protein
MKLVRGNGPLSPLPTTSRCGCEIVAASGKAVRGTGVRCCAKGTHGAACKARAVVQRRTVSSPAPRLNS